MFVIDSIETIIIPRLPMHDSTPMRNKANKIVELKNRIVRPSAETLLFLQLFARAYEPNVAV